MKKTYFAPETEVMLMETEQMVCTSGLGEPHSDVIIEDEGDVLSRQFGISTEMFHDLFF